MHFEDSTHCRHRNDKMFRQYLSGRERKLFQVPSNSIRKVRIVSPWVIFVFTWMITTLEPANPRLRLREWVNALSKHQAKFSVSRFVSEALAVREETKACTCVAGAAVEGGYMISRDIEKKQIGIPYGVDMIIWACFSLRRYLNKLNGSNDLLTYKRLTRPRWLSSVDCRESCIRVTPIRGACWAPWQPAIWSSPRTGRIKQACGMVCTVVHKRAYWHEMAIQQVNMPTRKF
jgi:hypothetical protein